MSGSADKTTDRDKITDKDKTNIVIYNEYRFTRDNFFAIKPYDDDGFEPEFQTNSNSLYIKKNFKINCYSALAKLIDGGFLVKQKNTQINKKSYNEYKFYRLLKDERKYKGDSPINNKTNNKKTNENDCLKFAECLTFANEKKNMENLKKLESENDFIPKSIYEKSFCVTDDNNMKDMNMYFFNKLLKAEYNPPILQSTSKKYFGATDDDDDNIIILNDNIDKGNDAIPINGQSYAIIRTKLIYGAPYHAAFVLYTHNGVNITLEAEADNKDNYQPKFSFYDTNPNGNTFHKRWSAELFKDSEDDFGKARYNGLYYNGVTIVLESRNIDDVINEKINDIINEKIEKEEKKKKRTGSITVGKRTGLTTRKRDLTTNPSTNLSRKRTRV